MKGESFNRTLFYSAEIIVNAFGLDNAASMNTRGNWQSIQIDIGLQLLQIFFSIFADNMPPQGQTGGSWVLYETDAVNEDTDAPVIVPPSAEKREWKIVWRNVILMGALHIGGVYGAYLFLTKAMWTTCFFGEFILFYL